MSRAPIRLTESEGRLECADLTLFKAMGIGLSDFAMGTEILARAREKGRRDGTAGAG